MPTQSRPKAVATDRVKMQVRVPIKLKNRLEKEATRRIVSTNVLVERALESALQAWEQDLVAL